MVPEVNLKKLILTTVKLADESEWDGSAATTTDGENLVVSLNTDTIFAEAFTAFSNPEKTSRIEVITVNRMSKDATTTVVYEGFTKMVNIGTTGGKTVITLKKPAA